eukprot:364899-Chlamydomonas_euryale.AAC.24
MQGIMHAQSAGDACMATSHARACRLTDQVDGASSMYHLPLVTRTPWRRHWQCSSSPFGNACRAPDHAQQVGLQTSPMAAEAADHRPNLPLLTPRRPCAAQAMRGCGTVGCGGPSAALKKRLPVARVRPLSHRAPGAGHHHVCLCRKTLGRAGSGNIGYVKPTALSKKATFLLRRPRPMEGPPRSVLSNVWNPPGVKLAWPNSLAPDFSAPVPRLLEFSTKHPRRGATGRGRSPRPLARHHLLSQLRHDAAAYVSHATAWTPVRPGESRWYRQAPKESA